MIEVPIKLIALRTNEKIQKIRRIFSIVSQISLSSLFFYYVSLNKRYSAIYEYPLVRGELAWQHRGHLACIKAAVRKMSNRKCLFRAFSVFQKWLDVYQKNRYRNSSFCSHLQCSQKSIDLKKIFGVLLQKCRFIDEA